MISSCWTRSLNTPAARNAASSLLGWSAAAGSRHTAGRTAVSALSATTTTTMDSIRWKSSSSSSSSSSSRRKSFRPRRAPNNGYYSRLDRARGLARRSASKAKPSGPREPNDISTPIPRIDRSQIRIRDALDLDGDDDLTTLGPLMGGALRALRHEASSGANQLQGDVDALESELKMMDFFTSVDGSTEDRVGARRAVAADGYHADASSEELLRRIDELVDRERFEYMELPTTNDLFGAGAPGDAAASGGGGDDGAATQIPRNQLAHGEW
eukprot:jgi/Psemu1/31021/gm1.31021_g